MNNYIHRGRTVQEIESKKDHEEGPRITREKETVLYMITIFCKGKHKYSDKEKLIVEMLDNSISSNHSIEVELCNECLELQQYASRRLSLCQFGENKSTCANCAVHCYAPSQRERIKEVMRYAGPRMLWSHPVLTIRHMLDGRGQKTLRELGS
ncbi:Nitrous oxide-stimulated promoter [Fontibacillus panacisegetis]|uniref:Nitrous oxide-stimulated promoter n=1 Tax=Fontibacillus panacisegetis TaxID=670482 RepID=A0A1G7MAR2_9BACL|nr:nitrous oxide-stimulated promoter family protein [Fontibacillus panacisegetis]SDF58329.1 Nitrous oxide-stimulated promoter [Fontibacillus panacisegetis]